jgi:hypothetical protein
MYPHTNETRSVTGTVFVSVLALSNVDFRAGTGTYTANGCHYEAVRLRQTGKGGRALWQLNGNYTTA